MTDSRGEWPPQYPQRGQGQQYPNGQPWQPQRPWPPLGQPWPQPGYGQPPGQPPQQYPPEPPFPPQGPPGHRDRKSWPARHKALTGLLAFGALLLIGGIANATGGTPKTTAATSAATAPASVPASPSDSASVSGSASASPSHTARPSCLTRMRRWLAGGGDARMGAFSGDLNALGTASGRLAASETSSAATAVRVAAASLASGAGALEANAGPSCVPGMRRDLISAARDYSQAASGVTRGMDQLTAGNNGEAVADIHAASAASGRGNGRIDAATAAVKAFAASSGA